MFQTPKEDVLFPPFASWAHAPGTQAEAHATGDVG